MPSLVCIGFFVDIIAVLSVRSIRPYEWEINLAALNPPMYTTTGNFDDAGPRQSPLHISFCAPMFLAT